SEITLKGLKSLIRACPLLQTLGLAINATQLSFASSTTPGEDIHNDKIQTLDMGESIIENPADVARILGELFWSLKKVDVSYYRKKNRNPCARLWNEVNPHLRKTQTRKRKVTS
ncbi:hypothetical protein BJ138DRAFT_1017068, partial [Hygrophoropsis aurantiaca]